MTQNEEALPSFNSLTAAFPAYLVIFSLALDDEAQSRETYWQKREKRGEEEGVQKKK